MRMTTGTGALVVILAFALVAAAQSTNPAKLRVNGVGLDSTYAQVIKAMGRPAKVDKPRREECIGGRERKLEFNGASFYLMDGDSADRKTFEVKGFEITSARFSVSGIRIGDSELTVRRRLGTKFEKSDEDGTDAWSYEFPDQGNPGFTTVYIRKGKVVKIASSFMVC